jgi:anti-sigma B factor antagonist
VADFVESTAVDGGPCVLELIGDVDITASEELVDRARACLGRAPSLELDLGALTFIDSSGLGALVRIRNEARGEEKPLVLTNVNERTARLLRITGLDKSFDVRPEQA